MLRVREPVPSRVAWVLVIHQTINRRKSRKCFLINKVSQSSESQRESEGGRLRAASCIVCYSVLYRDIIALLCLSLCYGPQSFLLYSFRQKLFLWIHERHCFGIAFYMKDLSEDWVLNFVWNTMIDNNMFYNKIIRAHLFMSHDYASYLFGTNDWNTNRDQILQLSRHGYFLRVICSI